MSKSTGRLLSSAKCAFCNIYIPPEPVVLLACGSFNPITMMHLRMMGKRTDNVQYRASSAFFRKQYSVNCLLLTSLWICILVFPLMCNVSVTMNTKQRAISVFYKNQFHVFITCLRYEHCTKGSPSWFLKRAAITLRICNYGSETCSCRDFGIGQSFQRVMSYQIRVYLQNNQRS